MNPIRAWNRFWFAPVSARPLGAFRVVYGAYALINLALLATELDYWFTDLGLLSGSEAREVAGPWRPSPLQWLQDPASVRIAFGAAAVSAFLLMIGLYSRLASVSFYLLMLSIHHRNVSTASGADQLLMVIAFYLMLSPCGAAYSIDSLREARRRGVPAEPLISPWSQRLLQIQIALVYLVTAVLKCNGATWLDGTAVHYVICNIEVGRQTLGWVAEYPVLINLMSYAGLAIEFALAFLLWFKAARPVVITLGIGLHLGILFMVNIPMFGELITATYLLFLTSAEFEAIRSRFSFLTRERSRPSPRERLGVARRLDHSEIAPPRPHPARPTFVEDESIAVGATELLEEEPSGGVWISSRPVDLSRRDTSEVPLR